MDEPEVGKGRERDEREDARERRPEPDREAADLCITLAASARSAITASWKLSPTERKRKPSECTTGNTASDSTGEAARPMKNVSMG